MEFREVRPGVATATLEDAEAVATLIVGPSRCLLVDTGSSPAQGMALRQAARRVADQPLEVVVVTHGHWDHAFGLAAFADLDTIGHEQLAQDLRCQENRRWAKRHRVKLDDLTVPRTSLSLIGVRDLGGLTVEIASFAPAHSRSDLVVAIGAYSTLIVGDLVEAAGPQFDETTSLDGWVKSLDALYALLRDDTLVIPGHGAPLDAGQVAHVRSGMAAIWDQAEWAFRQGVPVDQVVDFDNLEWPWDRTTAQRGIAAAYRELAGRPPRPDTGPGFW
jgi:glyoxylase-like metal-dependent hydrolase (beta-lactamase superfamily II)